MTRRTKTPKERAEESLHAAQRRVARLSNVQKRLQAELDAVSRDFTQAERRLAHALADPDLQDSDAR